MAETSIRLKRMDTNEAVPSSKNSKGSVLDPTALELTKVVLHIRILNKAANIRVSTLRTRHRQLLVMLLLPKVVISASLASQLNTRDHHQLNLLNLKLLLLSHISRLPFFRMHTMLKASRNTVHSPPKHRHLPMRTRMKGNILSQPTHPIHLAITVTSSSSIDEHHLRAMVHLNLLRILLWTRTILVLRMDIANVLTVLSHL